MTTVRLTMRYCVVLLSASAALLVGAGARAQEPPALGDSRVLEITPFAGYRMGGDFELSDTGEDLDLDDHGSFAIAIDLRRDPWSQYELFYGRQATQLRSGASPGQLDVDVEYLHLGGTLVVSEIQRRVLPYIVGTLGVTRFSPDPAEASDETNFSVSLGGGLRVPFSDRFALRLEARGFLTFVDTDSAVFCASGELGGVCAIRANGSSFIQYEILAGAAFAF